MPESTISSRFRTIRAKQVPTLSAFVFSGVHSSRLGRRRAVPETHQLAIKARKHAPWSAFWFPMPTHSSLRPSSPGERAGRYSSRGPRRGMRQDKCPSLGKETTDLTSRPAGGASGVPETGHAVSQSGNRGMEQCTHRLLQVRHWSFLAGLDPDPGLKRYSARKVKKTPTCRSSRVLCSRLRPRSTLKSTLKLEAVIQ